MNDGSSIKFAIIHFEKLSLEGIMYIKTLMLALLIAISQNTLAQEKPQIELTNQVAVVAELVNINSADAAMLSSLPGIGEKKAAAIVQYRTQNGHFTSLQALKEVKGIGSNILAKLEGKVKI